MYNLVKRFLRFLLIRIGFTILSLNLNAQEYIDIFKTSYSISPSNNFKGSESTTSLQEIIGDLTIPVKLNDSVAILTGLSYERISASLDLDQRRTTVSGFTLKIGGNIKHNSRWSGTYLFLPKLASDLKNIDDNDLQFGGAVLMKYKSSKRLNYKFGLYANQEHFGTFIVPMVGFYYLNSSKRFEAKVMLPLSVDLNYKALNNFKIGINFQGQVRSYNLNDSFGTGAQEYLSRSTNEIATYLRYEMNSGISFQTGVGHSFARSYQVYNSGVSLGMPLHYFGDDRKQLNNDFSDGWVFNVSLSYRLKLGEH